FPDGEALRVVVVSRSGTRAVAASWAGSATGSVAGTSLDGVVALARNDLAAVVVESTGGLQYASVAF
ncbi:anti-sigma factor, partial [Lentzea sp. NPDC060358]